MYILLRIVISHFKIIKPKSSSVSFLSMVKSCKYVESGIGILLSACSLLYFPVISYTFCFTLSIFEFIVVLNSYTTQYQRIKFQ
jgi:hypothetical protein